MKDNQGKVILSLLAGATAGIVAGLLLAPETGDETRAGLRNSFTKWGDDLSKLVKGALTNSPSETPGHTNPDAAVSEDKQAADRLLQRLDKTAAALGEPGDLNTSSTGNRASVAGNPDDKAHLTEQ